MKKLIFTALALFITNVLFSHELRYRVTEDTTGYPEYDHLPLSKVKKGTIVSDDNIYNNQYTGVFTSTLTNDSPVLIVMDDKTRVGVSLANLELPDCTTKLPEKILTFTKNGLEKKAIPSHFLDVLYSKNRNTVEKYEIVIGLNDISGIADFLDWNNYFFAGVTNIGIILNDMQDEFDFVNIKKISENVYECESIIIGKPDNDYDFECFTWFSINISPTSVGQTEIVTLTIDGDYLHIYNKSKGKPITTLAYVDDSVMSELIELFKNNKCDLSKVKWPHHADGTCDFNGNKKASSNVAQFMRMDVKENLKLREKEATTSKVLTIMKPGTPVRILEVGKAETIDGISSNWVKVDVNFNPYGHTGEPVIPSMTGWCFGGYLK